MKNNNLKEILEDSNKKEQTEAEFYEKLENKLKIFNENMSKKREQEFISLNEELNAIRVSRLKQLDLEIEQKRQYENKNFEQTKNELIKNYLDKKTQLEQNFDIQNQELKEHLKQLQIQKQQNIKLNEKIQDLESDITLAKSKSERIQEKYEQDIKNIQSELELEKLKLNRAQEKYEQAIKETKDSLNEEKIRFHQAHQDDLEQIRDTLKSSNSLLNTFEILKRKLGDKDPSELLKELNNSEEKISILREELALRPEIELKVEFEKSQKDLENLNELLTRYAKRNSELEKNQHNLDIKDLEISKLNEKNKLLEDQQESLKLEADRLRDDLKRINSNYLNSSEREDRIKAVTTPYLKINKSNILGKKESLLESQEYEIEWLDNVKKAIGAYGLIFEDRLIDSFHTALKTADFSPICVLAGASGTGKSELPRLYSHFGGINFINLSVQPNWDSQESMLGYFNSIDNKFDAQPALKFLCQTQIEKSDEYKYGLKDYMNLVLLDEMNLAHIELYFAEFLSKLEQRRGMKDEELPFVDIKLGAGIEPYKLPIGKNVLWTGTMNQDETTKSLSDKVMDRSIIINFPLPNKLESRKKLQPLENNKDLLTKELWQTWVKTDTDFKSDEIKEFKQHIENINSYLNEAGKALGHRVWQSIEYYMANYPKLLKAKREANKDEIKKAMRMAFEDQLAQKVMPKLNGVETRGEQKTKCLDKVENILKELDYKDLLNNFKFSCTFGHGQFIWKTKK